jgi:hypothetical protein
MLTFYWPHLLVPFEDLVGSQSGLASACRGSLYNTRRIPNGKGWHTKRRAQQGPLPWNRLVFTGANLAGTHSSAPYPRLCIAVETTSLVPCLDGAAFKRNSTPRATRLFPHVMVLLRDQSHVLTPPYRLMDAKDQGYLAKLGGAMHLASHKANSRIPK